MRVARDALDAAGFELDKITEAVGVRDIRQVNMAPAETLLLRLGDSELDMLVRLFIVGAPASVDAAAAIRPTVAFWVELGLAEVDGDEVRGLMRVVPDDEGILVSDWQGSSEREIRPDHVLGNNPTAAILDNVTIRSGAESFLDLGTGCGVQAIVAAKNGVEVTATDLNPRAVNVASFNALLNDVEVECLCGDLFAPVAERTFDLITSNPPFVISPESSYLFRDSEHGGEGITRRIAKEAPTYLREEGFFQMLCNWAHHEGEDWQESLREAFAGNGCDVWVIHTDEVVPAVYASGWLRGEDTAPERFRDQLDQWMTFYEREGITAVSWTIVTMRKRSGGDNWFDISDLDGSIDDRCGDHVRRCFEGRDFLARSDDEGILAAHPQVATDSRLEQLFAPEKDGWGAVGSRLATADGLPIVGNIDAHVANMLIRCDGKTAMRDVIARGADEAGVPLEAMLPHGLGMARRLFEGGHLIVE